MVEGTHPPTQNLNEAEGKAVSHPLTQCGQWQMTTYSNKTKTPPEDGERAGLRKFKLRMGRWKGERENRPENGINGENTDKNDDAENVSESQH